MARGALNLKVIYSAQENGVNQVDPRKERVALHSLDQTPFTKA